MARFTITEHSPAPARVVFAHLVDWDAHTAVVPLTRLTHDGSPAVGQRIIARTGAARFGFDDPMQVRELRPPSGDVPGDPGGVVAVSKSGRMFCGWVRWTVTATATGSVVHWSQELLVPWLPRQLDPLVSGVGRTAYRTALRRLLRPPP